jgi:plasmid stability protein
MTQLTLNLDDDLLDGLAELAATVGTTLEALVPTILRDTLFGEEVPPACDLSLAGWFDREATEVDLTGSLPLFGRP